ncbi:heavy-metal-associated domain-containing protein [Paenibacillus macerans]|uniref:heavy-metal-associated domain-containing protein n=1 Tax=Paenibacillus macerans TaxID=44252 RepID=UPI003D3198A8
MTTAKWKLEELTCPSCIRKIEGVLSKQEGVREAKVWFHSSQVKVVYDEGRVKAEQLQRVVEQLGYPVLDAKIS